MDKEDLKELAWFVLTVAWTLYWVFGRGEKL
jgi:hypothetical protein